MTHPAFGRRIKALEVWAGTPLVERNRIPMEFDAARRGLVKDRHAGRRADEAGAAPHSQLGNEPDAVLRIATGRSLARTQVADWIAHLCKKTAPNFERYDTGRYCYRHDARHGEPAGARSGRFTVLLQASGFIGAVESWSLSVYDLEY